MSDSTSLLERFEALEIPAPDFHHEDHVRVAYAMLETHDFFEACTRYARTIQEMATRVGVPEKFNATITIAFMSLVAERRAHATHADPALFLADNPDLLDKTLLRGWYSEERLTSATARAQFLLPDLKGASA